MAEVIRYLDPNVFTAIGGERGKRGRALSTIQDIPETGRTIFPKDLAGFLENGNGQLAIDINGGVIAIPNSSQK